MKYIYNRFWQYRNNKEIIYFVINIWMNNKMEKSQKRGENMIVEWVEFRNTIFADCALFDCIETLKETSRAIDRKEYPIVKFDKYRTLYDIHMWSQIIVYKDKELRDQDLLLFEQIDAQPDEEQSTKLCWNFEFEDKYCIIVWRRLRTAKQDEELIPILNCGFMYDGVVIDPKGFMNYMKKWVVYKITKQLIEVLKDKEYRDIWMETKMDKLLNKSG